MQIEIECLFYLKLMLADTGGCTWVEYTGYDLISSHGLTSPSSANAPTQRNLGVAQNENACRQLCLQHSDCVAYSYYMTSHSSSTWRQYCMGTSLTAHTLQKDTTVTSAVCLMGGKLTKNIV